jgi:hypothetical protein
LAQSPLSTTPTSNPIRGSTSPRDTVNFPVSPPHGTPPVSSPPRVSSPPKGRPSTSSSKESGKEQGRHSKLSVSEHSPVSGIEKMTFVPILDPSAFWEEEEDTGFIATATFPTSEPDSR